MFAAAQLMTFAQNCPKEKADTTFTPDREPVDPTREQLLIGGDPAFWHFDQPGAVGENECAYHGSTRAPGRCGTPLVIEIDRVVGRGKAGTDVQASGPNAGSLVDPNLLISNKLLAPRACISLTVSAGSVDNYFNPPAARVTLLLNGRTIGAVDLPAGVVNYALPDVSFWFDASILRFGTRQMTDGLPAGANIPLPSPGQNRFEATVTFGGNIPESRLVSLFVQSLSFEAKSPIILQHGIQGCNNYFTPSYRYNSGSPVLDPRIARLLESIGAGFAFSGNTFVPGPPLPVCEVLSSSLAPTSPISLSAGRALTIAAGGATLHGEIRRIARSFGASRVHVLAHSKGGLWSRHALGGMQYLEYAAPGVPDPTQTMK